MSTLQYLSHWEPLARGPRFTHQEAFCSILFLQTGRRVLGSNQPRALLGFLARQKLSQAAEQQLGSAESAFRERILHELFQG